MQIHILLLSKDRSTPARSVLPEVSRASVAAGGADRRGMIHDESTMNPINRRKPVQTLGNHRFII